MSAPKYHLTSYGCQMNKLDSELVESKLRQRGYQLAASEGEASVVLINTCSVRQHAEDRVWSKLGQLRMRKRTEPQLVVGVLGCMAQEHKQFMLARMPHVDLVVGPSAFGDIDQTVEQARIRNLELVSKQRPSLGKRKVLGAGVVAVDLGVSGDTIVRDVKVRPHRSQAFVSIMRGCNMPCTYCIVPTTRGEEISRPIADIVEEASRLCADGVTEMTLLGQTVNAYGRDLGTGVTLARLLRALHEIPALRRLAFITSHPNFLSADLIAAMAELPKLARYLHLPVQSGSNAVLKNMRRGYTVERYLARVEQLLLAAPDYVLHSDFIVGYPGETDADFAKTVALVLQVQFAQSYIFKYSPRPGTVAAELADDVPLAIKEARNQELLNVQEEITQRQHIALIGSTQEVLVEGPSQSDPLRLSGRTAHHRIVHFDGFSEDLVGRYVPVRIRAALGHSLLGDKLGETDAEQGVHDKVESVRV
ncbi:MAG: tRNA (N6-isopentenyl adenosine(37)-C2)-methylthiotransferase MiaB [Planctomycetota bacterium]|jgi:tRNA-2-methylthio-N6-dimethylallyladenosine synthase|nr:tRNA (N6-isopentenyl adenosine(37)-C2)-methylthiotransferase MiaB [Planctomycetota bacterium]MSR37670.1 tRNA (N6-isopentenyl adenosine(37)-C2)-methylthiotransferase MiaB [Planctomycetota bacterium]